MNLTGKVVVITGAARGIGAETARIAAARGARVALLGLEPELLAAVAEETGGVWYECDVTAQEAVDAAIAGVVEAYGGIDVIVANAGVANLGTVRTSPVESVLRTVEVNLVGAMRTVSAALPFVVRNRGYVLLVSSAAAFTALPGMAAYCASKAGLEQFGNALRLEVAHLGVGVGVAHMTWIDTDMVRDIRSDLPSFGQALSRLPGPLGALTTVSACANAFIGAIERRRRRVYVPRTLAPVQWLRSLVLSPLGDAPIRRHAARSVPAMEAQIAKLGRNFGVHSTGTGR